MKEKEEIQARIRILQSCLDKYIEKLGSPERLEHETFELRDLIKEKKAQINELKWVLL